MPLLNHVSNLSLSVLQLPRAQPIRPSASWGCTSFRNRLMTTLTIERCMPRFMSRCPVDADEPQSNDLSPYTQYNTTPMFYHHVHESLRQNLLIHLVYAVMCACDHTHFRFRLDLQSQAMRPERALHRRQSCHEQLSSA